MHADTCDFPLAIASIRIDGNLPVPIYEQISRAVRQAIELGELPEGTPLPTGRELAQALGVSRNTVVAAYSRLVAENYLVSNTRRGTQVARCSFGSAVLERIDDVRGGRENDLSPEPARIQIGFRAQQMLQVPVSRMASSRPFALHAPDASFLPRNPLGRLLTEEFRRSSADRQHAAWQRFQIAISAHLRQMRGVHCEPAQVIPTTCLDSALDLTTRLMIDPGHCVLAEDPAIHGMHERFEAAGARIFPLPADGIDVDPARPASPPARMILVSPSLSFPFGRQMPDERRLGVLELARRSGAVVFENDIYSELTFSGSRLRAIQGHDRDGLVIYFGSMQETLGPQIRVGYLVVPQHLVDAFTEMTQRIAYGPDLFLLSALARFIDESQYAVHTRAIRSAYAARLAIAARACRAHFGEAAIVEPGGGFHLVILLPEDLDEHAVCRLAARHDLLVTPLSSFHRRPPPRAGIVIGLGTIPDRNVETMIRRLAEIVGRARIEARPLDLAS
jgi:GntR family transcriptional regulator/MocR family aminotransferase